MDRIEFTKAEARRFILLKQGLLGPSRYRGKRGVLDYVKTAGCVQFDPVDVCGLNADLVLQARVAGYRKDMLQELLYTDRLLYDHFDKNMSVIPMADWPSFARNRSDMRQWDRVRDALATKIPAIRALMETNVSVSTKDFDLGKLDWYWGETSLSRATLEAMFYAGELVVHHKERTIRHFAPAARIVPKDLYEATDPHPDLPSHQAWRVLRRIGAVGLLWNRRSDAWLAIWNLDAAAREAAFRHLIETGKLAEAKVEGIEDPLYLLSADLPLAEAAKRPGKHVKKATLIAPLDAMLWDRRLVKQLFGFDYTWEIYTPAEKVKYAHYALPILYGETFAGRAELRTLKQERILSVRRVWLEDGVKPSAALSKALQSCFARFAAFSDCATVRVEDA